MGFKMSLRYENFGQQMNLLLRGAMTYQVDLGTDGFGNITRINNALDKLSERLDGAISQRENLHKQIEAAKLELANPFAQESELEEKEARLALLNADLNIDGDGGLDIMNEADSLDEQDDASMDDPDGETNNEDELDEPISDEAPTDYRYFGESTPQAISAKTKPSILEGIRGFDSNKHNGVTGKIIQTERGI
jgi:hypothetical protein